jgi:DNA repair protein RecO (recombination protein O)
VKWQRIELQQAYVLHTRPYRETSLLVEAFTYEQGRISLVAKGVRRPKSKWRGLVQPFAPLLLSWVGRTELYTLVNVEAEGRVYPITGERLLCGLYVNELLLRVLHREDSHPILFEAYSHLLDDLSSTQQMQRCLRRFEKRLLQELGYAFSLTHDCKTAHPINAEQFYHFDPLHGLYQETGLTQETFSGASILALAQDNLQQEHLREAKRLLRMALISIVGDKPLRSRELFIRG